MLTFYPHFQKHIDEIDNTDVFDHIKVNLCNAYLAPSKF